MDASVLICLFWIVAISLLLWENLLCFPLQCLLHFCLSLHPFQFLPEVYRCYNDWLFLSSFPDKAITWRSNHLGKWQISKGRSRGRQCREVNNVFCRTNTITGIHCRRELMIDAIIYLQGRSVSVDTIFLNSVTGLFHASFNKSPNVSFVILCPGGWRMKFL